MKKNSLKLLALAGCLAIAQGAVAHDEEEVRSSEEQIFVAGCGAGGCSGQKAPRNNHSMTSDEEQQYLNQGQGQGHACSGSQQPRYYQNRSV